MPRTQIILVAISMAIFGVVLGLRGLNNLSASSPLVQPSTGRLDDQQVFQMPRTRDTPGLSFLYSNLIFYPPVLDEDGDLPAALLWPIARGAAGDALRLTYWVDHLPDGVTLDMFAPDYLSRAAQREIVEGSVYSGFCQWVSPTNLAVTCVLQYAPKSLLVVLMVTGPKISLIEIERWKQIELEIVRSIQLLALGLSGHSE